LLVQPKEVTIVEGYLALWHPEVRSFFDYSIFLDLPHKLRIKRRTKIADELYVTKILVPMHEQHIEPTKQHANLVVQVEQRNEEDLVLLVERELKTSGIL